MNNARIMSLQNGFISGCGMDADGKLVSVQVMNYYYSGVTSLYAQAKNLVFLKVPVGVTQVCCSDNNLTELELPEGVKSLHCFNNPLLKLGKLPESLNYILASPTQFDYESCEIETVCIFYDIVGYD